MRRIARRFAFVIVMVGFVGIWPADRSEGAVLKLKAARIGGVIQSPQLTDVPQEKLMTPGTVIVVDAYINGFSPNPLVTWQVTTDRLSHTSGTFGSLQPPDVACTSNSTCVTAFGTGAFCGTTDRPPANKCIWAFQTTSRADWVMAGHGSINGVNIDDDPFDPARGWRAASALTDQINDTVEDPGGDRYLGSFVIRGSTAAGGSVDAAGIFEYAFHSSGFYTFFLTPESLSIPLTLNPLILHYPFDCPVKKFISGEPEICSIDARQPFAPNGSNPAAYQSFAWNLSNVIPPDCPIDEFDGKNYAVGELPSSGTPILVNQVDVNGAQITVTFNRRISANRFTCVTYFETDPDGSATACAGFLPCDVDGNRTVQGADFITLQEEVEFGSDPPMELFKCDMDRSDRCATRDLLRHIDLQNGADSYPRFGGTTIPNSCPSP